MRLLTKSVARSQEVDGITGLDGASRAEGDSGECLKRELGLGSVGVRAGDDEAGCEGVDFVECQGGVEGLGEGRLLDGGADVGVMAGFDCEDRTGCGKVVLVHDRSCSPEVSGDSDTLENTGESNE